jgi:hypothetical protein
MQSIRAIVTVVLAPRPPKTSPAGGGIVAAWPEKLALPQKTPVFCR